jgi:protein-S-isoprenylcysteine O-methyltransferase Ste14
MATEQQTDHAKVRIFPPGVPLATVLVGVGLNYIWPIDTAGFAVSAPTRYWVGGLIVAGAFLGLGLWSVIIFRRGGQSENPWKPSPLLVERGPFRITRNPMYLQMVVVCIGFAVMLANLWILLLTPLCALLLHRFAVLPEEAYLEQKFGDAYRAYKTRVRRWL